LPSGALERWTGAGVAAARSRSRRGTPLIADPLFWMPVHLRRRLEELWETGEFGSFIPGEGSATAKFWDDFFLAISALNPSSPCTSMKSPGAIAAGQAARRQS
jgi:hypothetical protein